jgi:hypothetical protein
MEHGGLDAESRRRCDGAVRDATEDSDNAKLQDKADCADRDERQDALTYAAGRLRLFVSACAFQTCAEAGVIR